MQVIFAIAGTLILSWRAPWAIVVRTTVWHSAWFRWSIYKLWSRISGDPLPPPTMSPQSLSDSLAPVQSLRFLFSIYENQRWWVGLDWTAVLLPAERPSWCTASQLPIPPPSAFTLPENTTIYLPDAKGNRMKRTAIWKWEEPEWRVLVRKDGSGLGLTRVERPLSIVKDDTPNSSRFLKVATGRGGLLGQEIPKNTASGNADEDSITPESEEAADEDLTDSDGWIYGDNKWENQSNRGVMGKVGIFLHKAVSFPVNLLYSTHGTEDGHGLRLYSKLWNLMLVRVFLSLLLSRKLQQCQHSWIKAPVLNIQFQICPLCTIRRKVCYDSDCEWP